MQFYYVRHCQSIWNEGFNPNKMTFQNKLVENSWIPNLHPEWFKLTKKGKIQATKSAQKLVELLDENHECNIFGSGAKQVIESAKPFIELYYENCQNTITMNSNNNLAEFSMNGFQGETKQNAITRFSNSISEIITMNQNQTQIIYGHQDIGQFYFSYMLNQEFDFIENGEIISFNLNYNNRLKILNRYKIKL